MRLLVGVFLRGTGSVLAAGVVHGVFNASNNRGGLMDGLLKDADQNLAAPIAMVVVMALVGVAARRSSRGANGSPDAAAPAGPGAGTAQHGGSPVAELPNAAFQPPQLAVALRSDPHSQEGLPC
jgi:hypothetical protein